MKYQSIAITLFLTGIGCLQMIGDVTGLDAIKAVGAATGASPAPKVFTAQRGFETYANRFYLEWEETNAHAQQRLELTPATYAYLKGPYNRRNVYGAVISYAPVLASSPKTQAMFTAVLNQSFCQKESVIAKELGLPSDIQHIRIRLEPRRSSPSIQQNFKLAYEVNCNEK